MPRRREQDGLTEGRLRAMQAAVKDVFSRMNAAQYDSIASRGVGGTKGAGKSTGQYGSWKYCR